MADKANVGACDVQELTPGNHNLIPNALAVDSSLGSRVVPPHLSCSGIDDEGLNPDFFDLVIDGLDFGSIQGTDQCTGQVTDISTEFNDWWSGNAAVAAVTTKQVHGVSAGSTDAFASGRIAVGNGGYCTFVPDQVQAPVVVQGIPTSETTQFYGAYQITEGTFEMTLNPGIYNYDSHYVEESSPTQGANSCWWKGSGMVQNPTVVGSTWTVGQSPAPHDGYGLDGVGFPSGVVNLIQTQGAANGVSFPCVVTIYQEMTYEGDANTFYAYTENILTQTITSNTVKVCRAGVCSGTIPF